MRTGAAPYVRENEEKERTYLGAGQDDFPRDEDEEHDFRLDHAVDQTREELRVVFRCVSEEQRKETHLRLVAAELPMAVRESLQANGELAWILNSENFASNPSLYLRDARRESS
jgi:hypothetical protein